LNEQARLAAPKVSIQDYLVSDDLFPGLHLSEGVAPLIIGDFSAEESDWLPPVEMRKPGFRTNEEIYLNRFATPVDAHNRVLIDELIEQVKDTVDASYAWPGYADLHHTRWPWPWYEAFDYLNQDSFGTARHYRELPDNKFEVPRLFHNWIHKVSVPPPLPRSEVMRKEIEEWNEQAKFHDLVATTTKLTRVFERERERRGGYDETQQQMVAKMVGRRLGSLATTAAALESIPPDRLPWAPDMTLQERAGRIGRLVRKGSHQRIRAVRPEVA